MSWENRSAASEYSCVFLGQKQKSKHIWKTEEFLSKKQDWIREKFIYISRVHITIKLKNQQCEVTEKKTA